MEKRFKFWLALAPVLIGLFSGCKGQPELTVCPVSKPQQPSGASLTSALNNSGTLRLQVVNAVEDPVDTFAAVACVGGGDPAAPGVDTGPCASGTLITPDLILTAKHLGPIPQGGYRNVKFGPYARSETLEAARAIKCWEFRTSGPAECCDHVAPESPSYPAYLATCPKPLGANEYVISDLAVWQLDHSITDITPIPVALTNPDGSHDLGKLSDAIAVEVGYGYGSLDSCTTGDSATGKSGTRRYGAIRLTVGMYYDNAYLGGPGSTQTFTSNTMIAATYDSSWPYTAPGDSGGPILVSYGPKTSAGCVSVSDLRVIGTAYRACNYAFSVSTVDPVYQGLKTLLDQDAAR